MLSADCSTCSAQCHTGQHLIWHRRIPDQATEVLRWWLESLPSAGGMLIKLEHRKLLPQQVITLTSAHESMHVVTPSLRYRLRVADLCHLGRSMSAKSSTCRSSEARPAGPMPPCRHGGLINHCLDWSEVRIAAAAEQHALPHVCLPYCAMFAHKPAVSAPHLTQARHRACRAVQHTGPHTMHLDDHHGAHSSRSVSCPGRGRLSQRCCLCPRARPHVHDVHGIRGACQADASPCRPPASCTRCHLS